VADSLKITINGSFGKLGNYYSALYAPDLMVQVTVTGQLALLKLIEYWKFAALELYRPIQTAFLSSATKTNIPQCNPLSFTGSKSPALRLKKHATALCTRVT
jgi:hypothetical protein